MPAPSPLPPPPDPALFERDQKGREGLVNYRLQGQFIVVDEVPNTLVMRLGKKTAVLINRNPPKQPTVRIAERCEVSFSEGNGESSTWLLGAPDVLEDTRGEARAKLRDHHLDRGVIPDLALGRGVLSPGIGVDPPAAQPVGQEPATDGAGHPH